MGLPCCGMSRCRENLGFVRASLRARIPSNGCNALGRTEEIPRGKDAQLLRWAFPVSPQDRHLPRNNFQFDSRLFKQYLDFLEFFIIALARILPHAVGVN